MEDKIEIGISKKLFEKIRSNINEGGFDSVDEYIEFVMNEFLVESNETQKSPKISEEEEKIIKERLKSLGYLE